MRVCVNGHNNTLGNRWQEWHLAWQRFNEASSSLEVDEAIYRLKAAEIACQRIRAQAMRVEEETTEDLSRWARMADWAFIGFLAATVALAVLAWAVGQ